jgi:hypothetical protein
MGKEDSRVGKLIRDSLWIVTVPDPGHPHRIIYYLAKNEAELLERCLAWATGQQGRPASKADYRGQGVLESFEADERTWNEFVQNATRRRGFGPDLGADVTLWWRSVPLKHARDLLRHLDIVDGGLYGHLPTRVWVDRGTLS